MSISAFSSNHLLYSNSSAFSVSTRTPDLSTKFESNPVLEFPENSMEALFSMVTLKGSVAVFRAEDYSDENPVYRVTGKYQGVDYEELIDVSRVNGTSASLIEMSALQTHLREKGLIDEVELHPYLTDDSIGFFDQINFHQLLKEWYDRSIRSSNFAVSMRLSKILTALGE